MKALQIETIRMLELKSGECTPTAVLFRGNDSPLIGKEALQHESFDDRANKNFKIVLGEQSKATVASRKKLSTADGKDRSAYEISSTFIRAALDQTSLWPDNQYLNKANGILVAEPLRFLVDSEDGQTQNQDWLRNYRAHLRSMLSTHFECIDFLSEPFAAYIYFREGHRHRAITDRRAYTVLVLDFGGGTFDASVIATTKTGDIAKSGVNAKPLSAASKAIGGEQIDTLIAQECMMSALLKVAQKKELRTLFNRAEKYDAEILKDLNEKKRSALKWLSVVTRRSEKAKIELTNCIYDWNPKKIPPSSVSIEVPLDPWDPRSPTTEIAFSAQSFFDLFSSRIWNDGGLRSTIAAALRRAQTKLGARNIDVVMMSGGTANIGWLRDFVKLEFDVELADATFIRMEGDFQNIVSLGLAAESARRNLLSVNSDKTPLEKEEFDSPAPPNCERFDNKKQPAQNNLLSTENHAENTDLAFQEADSSQESTTEISDFDGVLYNNIYIKMSADDNPPVELTMKPWDETTKKLVGAETNRLAGELLSSGLSIRNLVDKELTWKVRLPQAPKHKVNFKFLRTLDGEESVLDEYNVDQSAFCRGESKEIASRIWLQIKMREDGTILPTFIFKRDIDKNVVGSIDGREFAIDATDSSTNNVKRVQQHSNISTTRIESQEDDQSRFSNIEIPQAQKVDLPGSVTFKDVYIGLDFGSSNSSFAYVSRESVEIFDARESDASGLDLSNRLHDLPAPVSRAAKRFLAADSESEITSTARELLEASLTYLAYVSYSQVPKRNDGTKLFKAFDKRSAGPLKKLWVDSMNVCSKGGSLQEALRSIWAKYEQQIDQAISEVNSTKHDTGSLSLAAVDLCKTLAVELARLSSSWKFGFFHSADVDPFSGESKGIYTIANGLPPFHEKLAFGAENFCQPQKQLPCLLDMKSGQVTVLAPLMLWHQEDFENDLLVFDSHGINKDTKCEFYKFKSTSAATSKIFPVDATISKSLSKLRQADVSVLSNAIFEVELLETDV